MEIDNQPRGRIPEGSADAQEFRRAADASNDRNIKVIIPELDDKMDPSSGIKFRTLHQTKSLQSSRSGVKRVTNVNSPHTPGSQDSGQNMRGNSMKQRHAVNIPQKGTGKIGAWDASPSMSLDLRQPEGFLEQNAQDPHKPKKQIFVNGQEVPCEDNLEHIQSITEVESISVDIQSPAWGHNAHQRWANTSSFAGRKNTLASSARVSQCTEYTFKQRRASQPPAPAHLPYYDWTRFSLQPAFALKAELNRSKFTAPQKFSISVMKELTQDDDLHKLVIGRHLETNLIRVDKEGQHVPWTTSRYRKQKGKWLPKIHQINEQSGSLDESTMEIAGTGQQRVGGARFDNRATLNEQSGEDLMARTSAPMLIAEPGSEGQKSKARHRSYNKKSKLKTAKLSELLNMTIQLQSQPDSGSALQDYLKSPSNIQSSAPRTTKAAAKKLNLPQIRLNAEHQDDKASSKDSIQYEQDQSSLRHASNHLLEEADDPTSGGAKKFLQSGQPSQTAKIALATQKIKKVQLPWALQQTESLITPSISQTLEMQRLEESDLQRPALVFEESATGPFVGKAAHSNQVHHLNEYQDGQSQGKATPGETPGARFQGEVANFGQFLQDEQILSDKEWQKAEAAAASGEISTLFQTNSLRRSDLLMHTSSNPFGNKLTSGFLSQNQSSGKYVSALLRHAGSPPPNSNPSLTLPQYQSRQLPQLEAMSPKSPATFYYNPKMKNEFFNLCVGRHKSPLIRGACKVGAATDAAVQQNKMRNKQNTKQRKSPKAQPNTSGAGYHYSNEEKTSAIQTKQPPLLLSSPLSQQTSVIAEVPQCSKNLSQTKQESVYLNKIQKKADQTDYLTVEKAPESGLSLIIVDQRSSATKTGHHLAIPEKSKLANSQIGDDESDERQSPRSDRGTRSTQSLNKSSNRLLSPKEIPITKRERDMLDELKKKKHNTEKPMTEKERALLTQLFQYLDARCKHTSDTGRLERILAKYGGGYTDESVLYFELEDLKAAYDYGTKEAFARSYHEDYVKNPDPMGNEEHYRWGSSRLEADSSNAECWKDQDQVEKVIAFTDNVMYYKKKMQKAGKRPRDQRLVFVNKMKIKPGMDAEEVNGIFESRRRTRFYQRQPHLCDVARLASRAFLDLYSRDPRYVVDPQEHTRLGIEGAKDCSAHGEGSDLDHANRLAEAIKVDQYHQSHFKEENWMNVKVQDQIDRFVKAILASDPKSGEFQALRKEIKAFVGDEINLDQLRSFNQLIFLQQQKAKQDIAKSEFLLDCRLDEDVNADQVQIKEFEDILNELPQIQEFGLLSKVPEDKVDLISQQLLEKLIDALEELGEGTKVIGQGAYRNADGTADGAEAPEAENQGDVGLLQADDESTENQNGNGDQPLEELASDPSQANEAGEFAAAKKLELLKQLFVKILFFREQRQKSQNPKGDHNPATAFFRALCRSSIPLPAFTLIRNGELKMERCTILNSQMWSALAQYLTANREEADAKIYKLTLDDCSMKDPDFAAVLGAVSSQNIIRSIEYANNEFRRGSCQALSEILMKTYPASTLESLRLSYLKTDQFIMYDLLYIIDEESQLKHLCLRGLPLNLEGTHERLASQLACNAALLEFDLSGSHVSLQQLIELAKILASNPKEKALEILDLSYINVLTGTNDPEGRIYQSHIYKPRIKFFDSQGVRKINAGVQEIKRLEMQALADKQLTKGELKAELERRGREQANANLVDDLKRDAVVDLAAEFTHHLTAYVREAKSLRSLDVSGMNIKEGLVMKLVEEGIMENSRREASNLRSVGLSDLGLSLNAKDFIVKTLCPEDPDSNLCKLNGLDMTTGYRLELEDQAKRKPLNKGTEEYPKQHKYTSTKASSMHRSSLGRLKTTDDILVLTRQLRKDQEQIQKVEVDDPNAKQSDIQVLEEAEVEEPAEPAPLNWVVNQRMLDKRNEEVNC